MSEGDSLKSCLTKLEREELFNKAEVMYKSGEIKEGVAMYLKCLQNLSVKSSFNSLPKCLRALAKHFFEEQDYEKSVHFIQAERLYYESALLDTTSFLKKINEVSNCKHKYLVPNEDGEEVYFDDQQLMEDRTLEYEYLMNYFKDKQKYDFALVYADKCLKMKKELLGTNHPSVENLYEEIEYLEECVHISPNNTVTFPSSNTSHYKDNLLSNGGDIFPITETFKSMETLNKLDLHQNGDCIPESSSIPLIEMIPIAKNSKNPFLLNKLILSIFIIALFTCIIYFIYSKYFITNNSIEMVNLNKNNQIYIEENNKEINASLNDDNENNIDSSFLDDIPLPTVTSSKMSDEQLEKDSNEKMEKMKYFSLNEQFENDKNEPLNVVISPVIETYKQLKSFIKHYLYNDYDDEN